MPFSKQLETALETMHEANASLKAATVQEQESREALISVLEDLSGSVLPLQGIANMIALKNGRTIYYVNRGSLLDGGQPRYFLPDYYKIGNIISQNTVVLGHPESEDPHIGFHADIGSLSLASEALILESRPSETVAQV